VVFRQMKVGAWCRVDPAGPTTRSRGFWPTVPGVQRLIGWPYAASSDAATGIEPTMTLLILGLILFLGVHSARVFAEPWRQGFIARRGEMAWKGVYSGVALVGIVLLSIGYGQARQQPVVLWPSPGWTRHLAALLTLVAFVMLAAAYVPRNHVKAALKHPMVLGVKVWAFAHLVANNTLADVLLFGGFLVWAVLSFRAARGRDRAAGTVYPAGEWLRTAIVVFVGVGAWAAFAMKLHLSLIGVAPFVVRSAG